MMSNLPLGSSTWTFNGLLPAEFRDIVDGHTPCAPGLAQGIHAYFVEMASAILHSGIKAVELWYSPVLHDEQVLEQLRRLASAQRIASMHAPFGAHLDISSLDDQIRSAGVDACISAAELLAGLGGKTLVVHSSAPVGNLSEMPERSSRTVKSVVQIADSCRELGVNVALELLPSPLIGSTAPELLALLQLIDRTNVGICLDVNHVQPPSLLTPTIYSLAPHLLTLHIADYQGIVDDHWLPTLGIIDWPALIQALREVDYLGPFMYEVRFDAPSIADAVSALQENYRAIVGLTRNTQHAT